VLSKRAGRKFLRKRRCYLIEWEGYQAEENTWEDESCLLGNFSLIDDFEKDLEKAFPDSHNLLLTGERIVLPDAFDPEKASFTAPPLSSKTNSSTLSNGKRAASDSPKGGSPRKSQRKTVSPELEYEIPEKLKSGWTTIKKGYGIEVVRNFLSSLNNSIVRAKKHTHELTPLSGTHSVFEGVSPPVYVVNTVDGDLFPRDFVYIDSMVFGDNVSPPDAAFLVRCECDGSSCSSLCHDNEENVYSAEGCIQIPQGIPVYECNDSCACSSSCHNRVVQRGRQVPLEIYKTKHKGWGVRSTQNISEGMFVEQYIGEVITNQQGNQRGKFYDKAGTTYLFDMDFGESVTYVIDSFLLGNASHFFNHSCSPNLSVYAVYSDSGDPNFHRLAFFANRPIKAGEELTIDYEGRIKGDDTSASSRAKPGKGTFKCHCSAKNCRKYIHE
ncbi:hypothetical protein BJV82DRAFT_333129, partial [Fennellomyces sp. T-0311]